MKYQTSFRHLIVWNEAKKLTVLIYKITQFFPKNELYGLISQLRRAAYSIMANIAEGNARKTIKDRAHFFIIAGGSLTELDCLLELACDLHFCSETNYKECIEAINKTAYLLRKFIKSQ